MLSGSHFNATAGTRCSTDLFLAQTVTHLQWSEMGSEPEPTRLTTYHGPRATTVTLHHACQLKRLGVYKYRALTYQLRTLPCWPAGGITKEGDRIGKADMPGASPKAGAGWAKPRSPQDQTAKRACRGHRH